MISYQTSVNISTSTPSTPTAPQPVHGTSVQENSNCSDHLLPCFAHESGAVIKPNVLAQLLDGCFSDQIDTFDVIDCRYPYEFLGGHIAGAINTPLAEHLQEAFPAPSQASPSSNCSYSRHVLVFHCEFSSQRAPKMLQRFRKADRDRNIHRYPELDFPEVYLLEGGYKAFVEYCRANNRLDLITTSPMTGSQYVTMKDAAYRQEERYWHRSLGGHSFDSEQEPSPLVNENKPSPNDLLSLTPAKALSSLSTRRSMSLLRATRPRRLLNQYDDECSFNRLA